MRATRIIVLSAAIIIAALNCFGQQSKFKVTYDYNGDAEWGFSTLFLSDSTLLCNSMFNTFNKQGIIILHISNNGSLLNTNVYSRTKRILNGSWDGSLLSFDTFYYIGGCVQWQDSIIPTKGYSFPFVVKLNSTRDTVWFKDYEIDTAGVYLGKSCRKIQDRGILLYGSVSYRSNNPGKFDFYVIKLDTAGNLLWQKTYGIINVNERCTSVEELPSGRLLVSGVRFNSAQTAAYPWVMITDSMGTVEWQRLYSYSSLGGGVGVTHPAKTGGFIMMGLGDTLINAGDDPGNGYLARLNGNGDFVWKRFFNSPWFTQIWDFYELDNGDIVFCGEKIDSANNIEHGYLAKIDSMGNLLWWRTYYEKPTGYHYLSCIRPAPDGGFVACGSAVGITTNSQDAWIIKTDSLGCALVNCTLSTDDIAAMRKGFSVFPNPAQNEVNLSLSQGQWEPGSIVSAYDATGKKVVSEFPKAGSKTIRLNTSGWQAGVYIVTIQGASGNVASEKLIIVR